MGVIHTYYTCTCTVESRDYAPPPFLYASIGEKWGGGLYSGSVHFRLTTITDRWLPHGRAISALSLAAWGAKLEKNDKVRHITTQMASLLAVATVFVGLCTLNTYILQSEKGGLIRPKNAGGLIREGGGRTCGILLYWYTVHVPNCTIWI